MADSTASRARGASAPPGFLVFGAIALACAAAMSAGADPVETIVVTGRRFEHPAGEAPTASRTTIDVEARFDPGDSVADALAESAGVQVRRFGGLGAFSTVSIRGSAADQVLFFLDGVPLSRARTETIDLGSLPLESLERIDVYRGTTPLALGAGAAAGAVNLIPRRPGPRPQTQLEAGFGSFLTRTVTAAHGRRAGPLEVLAHVTYLGSEGDFRYFTDRNTPQQPADDGHIRRRNNGFDSVDSLLQVSWPLGGGGDLSLTHALHWKAQGVPGAAYPQATRTHLRTLRSVSYVRWRDPEALGLPLDAAATVFGFFEHLRFRDPEGELGPGNQDRSDEISTVGGDLALTAGPWGNVSPSLFVQLVRDVFAGFNELAPAELRDEPNQERLAVVTAAQANLSLLSGRLLLAPTVRLQHVRDHANATFDLANRPSGPAVTRSRDLWSPSIGARVRAASWLLVRANAGVYRRPPSFSELFGTRGSNRGNPLLRDEKAFNRDVGVLLVPPPWGPFQDMRLEYTYFDNELDDLIAFVSSGTGKVRPINIGAARIRGHEISLSATLAHHVRLSANHTELDAEDRGDEASFRGKDLPGRPQSETWVRLELFGPAGTLYYELSAVGESPLVRSNFLRAPARRVHTAGVLLRPLPHVTIAAEGRNLTDNDITDVFRFPLPGRSFFINVEVRI